MPSLLEDKDAIRELIISYCHYGDAGDGERWAALFAEDAVWEGGAFGRYEGRAAIRGHFERSKGQHRHGVFNTLVTVEGDTARALSYVIVFRVAKEGSSLQGGGHYQDRLVRVEGRWLFKHRCFRPVMKPEYLLGPAGAR